MANLSASILRNVISSVFNVESSKVVLSGILPENYDKVEDNSSGNLYSSNESLKLYAYHPTSGFVEVKGDNSGYSRNADGTFNPEYRITFAECQMYKDAQFFVELFHKEGWQQGLADWNDTIVTLYGAPDWVAIDKINLVKDLQRWVNWNPEQPEAISSSPIVMKGELSAFFQANYNTITDKGEKSLWGYDPNRGFEDLSTNVYRWEHHSGTNKPFISIYGSTLHCICDVERFTFFVVESRDADKSIWTIYDAPNFDSKEIAAAKAKAAAMLDNTFNHIQEDVY